MNKVRYLSFLILLTSFVEGFDVKNIASNVIVFMSILFGFFSTSFSLIIFSSSAKTLYAKQSEKNNSNEFYDIVKIYKSAFVFSLLSILMFLFSGELYTTFVQVGLLLGEYSKISLIILNLIMLLPICVSIYLFIKIIELNINFAVFSIRVNCH